MASDNNDPHLAEIMNVNNRSHLFNFLLFGSIIKILLDAERMFIFHSFSFHLCSILLLSVAGATVSTFKLISCMNETIYSLIYALSGN